MTWVDLTLDLPRGPVRAQSTGDGPLFLWTHGIFHPIDVDDRSPLGLVLPSLEGHRVVRHDTRGQGRTPPAATDDLHTWRELGRDLLDLASALGADRFVAGGISMGAAISLHAAVLAPERVEALVLLAPPTAWSTRPPQLATYDQLAALDSPALVAASVERDLLAAFPMGIPAPLRVMLSHLAAADPVALGHVLRAAARSDLPPFDQVAALRTPTLLLPWRGDDGHPFSTAVDLARALPHALLTEVAGIDDVATLLTAMRAFLASRSAPPRA